MVIQKTTAKLDEYLNRIDQPDAQRVEPSHVALILSKLHSKEADLQTEINDTENPDRAKRLQAKLAIVREQIRRGTFLMDRLSTPDIELGDT